MRLHLTGIWRSKPVITNRNSVGETMDEDRDPGWMGWLMVCRLMTVRSQCLLNSSVSASLLSEYLPYDLYMGWSDFDIWPMVENSKKNDENVPKWVKISNRKKENERWVLKTAVDEWIYVVELKESWKGVKTENNVLTKVENTRKWVKKGDKTRNGRWVSKIIDTA